MIDPRSLNFDLSLVDRVVISVDLRVPLMGTLKSTLITSILKPLQDVSLLLLQNQRNILGKIGEDQIGSSPLDTQ
jgi:hypothetical protein